ncbi:MAG: AraC family transcriptional regulator [Acidobacteria bacterium]|nr:AraC family transcriptional regulator [Acidobacteriota bacterium]
MLLDKLLSNLAVHVEPFALCIVSAGHKLPLPGPPVVMLHSVHKGNGVVHGPQGAVIPIAPSWLVVVPQGVPHSLESIAKESRGRKADAPPECIPSIRRIVVGSDRKADLVFACGTVRVRYGDSMNLFTHLREIVAVDFSDVPAVTSAFQGILAEQSDPGPGSEAMTAALMSQCLVHLLRHLAKGDDCPLPWLPALDDPRLARAIDRILQDPAQDHTVESLAVAASMSRSAFAERFSSAFGKSPMSLVHNVRMKRAAQLLRQGMLSTEEVADHVGFSSRSYFSHAFKKHSGVSPAKFRAVSA